MTELVAIDIGGTHTRFAIATIASDGSIALGELVTLATDEFSGIEGAWKEFASQHRTTLPKAAAIAIAAPVASDTVRMTNNSWEIDTACLGKQLGLERFTVLNDFAAVAHAAANAREEEFLSLSGPATPLPKIGTISVIGPGTGLGVAHFHRLAGGYHVQATEGSHIGFAPQDDLDDAILDRMRKRYGRLSVERVVSGPGIVEIYAALTAQEERPASELDDRTIWQRGLGGEDILAAKAVDRFCLLLGRVAGDIALAHGASGVVIAGGLGLRISEKLVHSGFTRGFCDKGRYQVMLAAIPVKVLTQPQPGLTGAVRAFAAEHGS
ncbi:MAG: glucokinase [Novosphingobium sp.]|nr:glucokinase [Novosphingobium sp.]